MNIQNTYTLHREEKPLFVNPMIRKISEIKEKSNDVSSYAGIFGKSIYFMMMIIVGIALALVFKGVGAIGIEAITDEVIVSRYAVITALVSVGMFILFPLTAFVFRKTIPVAGALYCASVGYLLGFILALGSELNGYMLLAMVLTFSLVAAMGFLYFKGYIHISDKFRAVTATLFTTMIISGCAMLICCFIPSLRESVLMLRSNPVISIAAAVGGIIIASMFLLIDFDTVDQTVKNRLPKEYEWFAAFSVVFTVVWLYFKVLDLVIKVKEL